MDNDKDFMRIEGHPEPLEIQESYGAAPADGAAPKAAKNVGKEKPDRVGDFIWAGVAAICALVLVGAVYFLSGAPNSDREVTIPETAYNATSIIEAQPVDAANAALAANSSAAMTAAGATAAVDGFDALYLFDTDVSEIPENARLNAVAAKAKKSGAYVTVTAYTDESGRDAYNQRLSERRAKSVADYLVAHGVAPDHVTCKGMGETHAYATHRLDRRAEIRLN